MKPWAERPPEEAHLLNPPFCCVVISAACTGYVEPREELMPFPLAFMILPIILHKHTRESLPRSARTTIPVWLQENADVRIRFHERLMALRPFTREALRYGLVEGWIKIGDSGAIQPTIPNSVINHASRNLEGDAGECVSRARFLGKWFGAAASTETTMALWGIRP